MSATLRLTRKQPTVELRRGPFEIELDGTSIGSINRKDEPLEIPVELLALAAVPAATAARTKKCTDKEVYAGKCGKLPTRSSLSMIPARRFGPVTVDAYLMNEDPDWVSIASQAEERKCGLREELIPPKPNTSGAALVATTTTRL
jgi:hypothetical protein